MADEENYFEVDGNLGVSNKPFLLSPAAKDYIWGGTNLKKLYNKNIDITPLAETWECSVHPDGESIIMSGGDKGRGLRQVLNEHPEWLGTHPSVKDGLPILVKLIDAEGDLSVQVHPDDRYAMEHEKQPGKTEMWYVLDAKPGAMLTCGFAHDVDRETVKRSIEQEKLIDHMHLVEVKKGDVFFIEPGTIHAIGAGIIIAEIQQNSNATYRVYDYGRKDKNGKTRELHIDKALDVLNYKMLPDIRQLPRVLRYIPGGADELLCRCKYFQVRRILINNFYTFEVGSNSFQVLLCTDGEGQIVNREELIEFQKGDCIFLPAGCGGINIKGSAQLLKIMC